MRIKELELKGYKRLGLSDIRHIQIDFDSDYQIILGSNGSGKSSLLAELSPLPAIPKQYNKGGFKSITIEHNDKTYVLLSNFDGKTHHSFKVQGEELNDGGTITVQRDLVKQHFSLTDEMFQLISGKLKFTQMTASKRRDFFTRMSNNDLTYAFELFKKLASKTRDEQGAVKHLKNRIAKETDLYLSMEDDELEKKVDTLQKELSTLMSESRVDLPATQEAERSLDQTLKGIHAIATEILETPFKQPTDEHFDSLESLTEATQKVVSDLSAQEQILSHYSEEYDRMNRLVGEMSEVGTTSVDELESRCKSIKKDIEDRKSKISMFNFQGDVSNLVAKAQDIKSQLIDALSNLPDNSNLKYSRTRGESSSDAIMNLGRELDMVVSKITRRQEHLQHIKDAKQTECPDCGYRWKPGVSERDVDRLNGEIEQLSKQEGELKKKLTELQEYKEAYNEYVSQFNRLRKISHSYPEASNLFDWLLDKDRIIHQPSNHIPKIDVWMNDLYLHSEIWSLENKSKLLESALQKAEMLGDGDASHIEGSLRSIENNINQVNTKIAELREKKKRYEWSVNQASHRIKLLGRMNDLHNQCLDQLDTTYRSQKNDVITNLIDEHQGLLAVNRRKLNERQSISNIIDDLKKSLADVEGSYLDHKLLCRALSPTDGIIAKQLTTFINTVVAQMNDILSQIYTYRIEIQPCGIESNDLDFKFPLEAEAAGGTDANDVSEGSEGQQEVINFTFQLIAMLYMDFENYPLFLDEVGRAQDEQHMTNIMNYVKLLIESNRHSQLFMISHFAAGHGAFTNANFLVLNPANISVPLNHNENVDINEECVTKEVA